MLDARDPECRRAGASDHDGPVVEHSADHALTHMHAAHLAQFERDAALTHDAEGRDHALSRQCKLRGQQQGDRDGEQQRARAKQHGRRKPRIAETAEQHAPDHQHDAERDPRAHRPHAEVALINDTLAGRERRFDAHHVLISVNYCLVNYYQTSACDGVMTVVKSRVRKADQTAREWSGIKKTGSHMAAREESWTP
ncbi:hypothetical protein PSP6_790010 [Paraburkholderia tropica]|nr:hypothetical protein PSP6_790010 [Paraburkholderia tropica]